MHFLPPKSRAALSNLGNFVDTKMSQLKQDPTVETTRFRQAVYINWTKNMLIPDPCDPEPGYKFVLARFLEQSMNSHNSRSATVCGHTVSINTLFQLWNFPIPGDLSDKDNTCSKIFAAQECKENIAKQCSPITKEMFAAMADKAVTSEKDSVESILIDWFCFIRITGLRVAKYAQLTQTSVDILKYPSRKQ